MLRPLDARVLVKKPERQEQTASDIILPDNVETQGQTALGNVIAVGPGSRNMNDGQPMPMDVKVGDTIVYTKFSATEIEHNSEQFFVVTERDIIAIVED